MRSRTANLSSCSSGSHRPPISIDGSVGRVTALIREADTLGPAGQYSETRTGLETWFTLPDKPAPAKPPANWKMAITTWVALFPMVVALAYIFAPFRLPFLVEVSLSTAIPVAMLTWVVMPALTRLLDGWLYPQAHM